MIKGIRLELKKGFFKKHIWSTTCLAVSPSGFTLVYSFLEVLKSTWFSAKSKTSRYLPPLHILLQFHRKKYMWEEKDCNLCHTQIPCWAAPSHGYSPIPWLFTHAGYLTPPEGCCRSVALNIQQQDLDSLCSTMRCPVHGESKFNLMMVFQLLSSAGTTS